MKTYIALLRGINVGGHRKIKMADLRALLEELNFSNVQTYIQSGNVVFSSKESKNYCTERIYKGIEENFGFEVPPLLLESQELQEILQSSPFSLATQKDAYYTILSKIPTSNFVKDFESISYPDEEIHLLKRCVYFHTSKGMGKTKYSNNLAERILKVPATTRNHRTLNKLIEMTQKI